MICPYLKGACRKLTHHDMGQGARLHQHPLLWLLPVLQQNSPFKWMASANPGRRAPARTLHTDSP
jgi:hypothetical protein